MMHIVITVHVRNKHKNVEYTLDLVSLLRRFVSCRHIIVCNPSDGHPYSSPNLKGSHF